MEGCGIIGDSKYPVKLFKENLINTGKELCDSCPYGDCIASDRQAVSLWRIQEQYKRTYIPKCDQKIKDWQKARLTKEGNARRREKNNPEDRRRGRPKKGEKHE